MAFAADEAKISVFEVEPSPGANYDGYLVHLRPGVSPGPHISPLRLGIETEEIVDNLFVIDCLEDAALLWHEGQIAYIEPNYDIVLFNAPNDPLFPYQWCMNFVNASALWDLGMTGRGVRVAVIDSGIHRYHEDFNQTRIAQGFNYIDNNTDTRDPQGHGTQVAGVIAAMRNNHLGLAGLLCEVTIIPLRVLDSGRGTVGHAIRAIYGAVNDFDAHVINMSFGLDRSATSQALENAINYADAHGVILVAAAGNHGTDDLIFPASFPNVISVGAVDQHGNVPSFSQRNRTLTVTAPGDGLLTLHNIGTSSYNTNARGTSFAAPFVAAMAAAARVLDPNMTTAQFQDVLIQSAVHRGPPGFNTLFGHGTVDFERFLAVMIPGQFIDVTGHWAYTSILNVVDLGLFTGTSGWQFSPNMPMSRAMFVTVLGRLYTRTGGHVPNQNDPFHDTVNDSWYSRYVGWAANNSIVVGTGGNRFSPTGHVTRQEAATILARFTTYIGTDTTGDPSALYTFVDHGTVAFWARGAMAWTVEQGLISGVPQEGALALQPLHDSSRAQVAVILERFIDALELELTPGGAALDWAA